MEREATRHMYMNTLEILYQSFRVRYSLNQLQEILDRGSRLALLGPGEAVEIIREFLGEPAPSIDEHSAEEDLVPLNWELGEQDMRELKTCDACIVLFPDGAPEVEELEELAGKIPVYVKTLFVSLEDGESAASFYEKDLTLPTVRGLPRGKARERFLLLLLHSLPQISLVLARNWSNLRSAFCRLITRRTALRNGVRAGLSSLPLKSVPLVGPVLNLLATSAETLMLTSSQLRLSFVVAAVHGRPLDFFDRIAELWPIVGTAFGFRGVSRLLVSRLPKFGAGLKASVAFAGTYAVGESCRLFYEHGQPTSDEIRRELIRRSHEEGAREAHRLFRKILVGQPLDEEDEADALLDAVDDITRPRKADRGRDDADVIEELEAEEKAAQASQKSRETSLAEEATVEIQPEDTLDDSLVDKAKGSKSLDRGKADGVKDAKSEGKGEIDKAKDAKSEGKGKADEVKDAKSEGKGEVDKAKDAKSEGKGKADKDAKSEVKGETDNAKNTKSEDKGKNSKAKDMKSGKSDKSNGKGKSKKGKGPGSSGKSSRSSKPRKKRSRKKKGSESKGQE